MAAPSLKQRCLFLLLALAIAALAAGTTASKDREPKQNGPGSVDAGVGRDAWGEVDAGTSGAHPIRAASEPDPRETGRLAMSTISRTVERLQRIRSLAPPDAYSVNCVTERLAEARIGVQIGDQEMARLEDSLARRDAAERAYALRRLQLLAERAGTVLTAARICIESDPGGVTATKVEVEISPMIPAGDPSTPPLPAVPDLRPANDGR